MTVTRDPARRGPVAAALATAVALTLAGVAEAAPPTLAVVGAVLAPAPKTLVVSVRLRCPDGAAKAVVRVAAAGTGGRQGSRPCGPRARTVDVRLPARGVVPGPVAVDASVRRAGTRASRRRQVRQTVDVRWRGALPDAAFAMNASGVVQYAAPDVMARHFELMRAAGIASVRIPGDWAAGEGARPTPAGHQYSWTGFDRFVLPMASAGLRWDPVIGSTPVWASGGGYPLLSPPAPERDGDFVAYARAFAQRYGRGGSFWRAHPDVPARPVVEYQVWNEPNAPQYGWTPERLAVVYEAVRKGVLAVDPEARVIPAALADLPGDDSAGAWTARLIASVGPRLTAADLGSVGVHLYGPTVLADEERLRDARTRIDAAGGRALALDLDEFGWSPVRDPLCSVFCPVPVAEPVRAGYYERAVAAWLRSDCGVRRIAPYVWLSDDRTGAVGSNGGPAGFGIWNLDGSPKPTGAILRDGVRRQRGLAPQAPPPDGVAICAGGAAQAPAAR